MKLLILLLTITILCFANEKENKLADNACVKGLSANLRSEPDLKSSIVVNLNKYTPLTVLEEKDQWTKVKSKNFQGWLFNDLLIKDIKCVMALQPDSTMADIRSEEPHSNRSQVDINEGFKIIETSLGKTKVEDKFGNTFWLENQYLWPKSELEDLNISL